MTDPYQETTMITDKMVEAAWKSLIDRLVPDLPAGMTYDLITINHDNLRAALEAAEKAAKAELATANTKLATFDTEVENAAQAKFASLGGPPIPSSGKDETQSKADITGLTGVDRVSAFFKSKEK